VGAGCRCASPFRVDACRYDVCAHSTLRGRRQEAGSQCGLATRSRQAVPSSRPWHRPPGAGRGRVLAAASASCGGRTMPRKMSSRVPSGRFSPALPLAGSDWMGSARMAPLESAADRGRSAAGAERRRREAGGASPAGNRGGLGMFVSREPAGFVGRESAAGFVSRESAGFVGHDEHVVHRCRKALAGGDLRATGFCAYGMHR